MLGHLIVLKKCPGVRIVGVGKTCFQKHVQEEYLGFLLIDAHNTLNEENRTTMLWEMRFEWLSGVWFALNCY